MGITKNLVEKNGTVYSENVEEKQFFVAILWIIIKASRLH